MNKNITAITALLFLNISVAEEIIKPSVVGGSEAASGAYPWMVALVRVDRESIDQGQFCGGMLIHPYWILTAAHCVESYDFRTFEVAVGDGDLSAEVDLHAPSGIFIHPEADLVRTIRSCDIALIRLEEPILGVTPVPLERAASALSIGRSIRSLGWGRTEFDSDSDTTSARLKQVEGFIASIEDEEENAPIRDYHWRVTRGGELAGTSGGDSGGPMLVQSHDDGEWRVAGVISFGIGESAEDAGDDYCAKVSYAAPWIDAHLEPSFFQRPSGSFVDRVDPRTFDGNEMEVGYRVWPLADGPVEGIEYYSAYGNFSALSFSWDDTRYRYNGDGSFTFLHTPEFHMGGGRWTSLLRFTQLEQESYGNGPIPLRPFERAEGYSSSRPQLTLGKRGIVFQPQGLEAGRSYSIPFNSELFSAGEGGVQPIVRVFSDDVPQSFTAEPGQDYFAAINRHWHSPLLYWAGLLPGGGKKIVIGETIHGRLSAESHRYDSPHTRAELLEYEGGNVGEVKLELYSDFDAEIQLFDHESAKKIGYHDFGSERETEVFIFSSYDFQQGTLAVFNFDKDVFGDFSATLSEHADPILSFDSKTQYAVTEADSNFPDSETGNPIYFQRFYMRGRSSADYMKVDVDSPYADLGVAVYQGENLIDAEFGRIETIFEFPAEPNAEYEIVIFDFENYRNANFEITVSDSQGPTVSSASTNGYQGDSKLRRAAPKSAAKLAPSPQRLQGILEAYEQQHKAGEPTVSVSP